MFNVIFFNNETITYNNAYLCDIDRKLLEVTFIKMLF